MLFEGVGKTNLAIGELEASRRKTRNRVAGISKYEAV
jgi:hypothetical protein